MFFTGGGGAPTSCDRRRRRRQQNGGGDRRRQRTENTRFSTKFKVTQSCETMTWLFDCNFLRYSVIFIDHVEFVIHNFIHYFIFTTNVVAKKEYKKQNLTKLN